MGLTTSPLIYPYKNDRETVENADSHMCALWIFGAKGDFKFEK